MNLSPDVLIKHLLSYLKTDWTAKDYPLRVRHTPIPATVASQEFHPVPWLVQIIGWEQMPGTGNTEAEALADLEQNWPTISAARASCRGPALVSPFSSRRWGKSGSMSDLPA